MEWPEKEKTIDWRVEGRKSNSDLSLDTEHSLADVLLLCLCVCHLPPKIPPVVKRKGS